MTKTAPAHTARRPLAGDFLPPSEIRQDGKRMRAAPILLVDENPVSRAVTLLALRKYGFHNLYEAEDGHAALAQMQKTKPDLVILDILLPDINGFQLCQMLREHEEWKDIPILAYTALEDEQERLSILRMGANDLAFKPITPEELMARCSIHLEKYYILKDLQDYRQRMEADLSNARTMQDLLMPDAGRISKIREAYGLDIQPLFAPSLAIGGDFWGVHPFAGTSKLAMFIGDFTGHGVTAALNVFRLSTLMARLPESTLLEPATFLQHLNQQLHPLLPTELFATMFYAVLDTATDSLVYSVAGSPPPLLLREERLPSFALLEGSGLPLAAISAPKYREHKATFRPGDSLLLYSDALIETPGPDGEYLSVLELGELLSDIPIEERSAANLLSHTLTHFRCKAEDRLADDLTLNVYRRM